MKTNIALATLAIFAWLPASATVVPDLPLNEQVREADVIVIGKVIGVAAKTVPSGDRVQYARVRVDAVLKGRPVAEVMFLITPGIAEANPLCCVKGGEYLLFLQAIPMGGYAAVSAFHSVFRLDANNPYNFHHPARQLP